MANKYKTKRTPAKSKPGNDYDPVTPEALQLYDRAAIAPKNAATAIITLLGPICAEGYPPSEVFLDFLNLTETMLDELPRHITSIRKTGQVDFTDPPAIEQFYAGLRNRYPKEKRWVWGNFCAAVSLLAFVSTEVTQDTIGQIYARWAYPQNKGVVIPFEEAVRRAKRALGDSKARVYEQLSRAGVAASENNPLAKAIIQAGILSGREAKTSMDDRWVEQFIRNNLLPAVLPWYEPVRIFDPAVGSGTLMLGASTLFDDWMVGLGLVRFEGADPDPVCLKMTAVNAKIYGLNGSHLKANRALLGPPEETRISLFNNTCAQLSAGEMEALPEALQLAYRPGDTDSPPDIQKERQMRQITLLEQETR